jgi:hypothetical protein
VFESGFAPRWGGRNGSWSHHSPLLRKQPSAQIDSQIQAPPNASRIFQKDEMQPAQDPSCHDLAWEDHGRAAQDHGSRKLARQRPVSPNPSSPSDSSVPGTAKGPGRGLLEGARMPPDAVSPRSQPPATRARWASAFGPADESTGCEQHAVPAARLKAGGVATRRRWRKNTWDSYIAGEATACAH